MFKCPELQRPLKGTLISIGIPDKSKTEQLSQARTVACFCTRLLDHGHNRQVIQFEVCFTAWKRYHFIIGYDFIIGPDVWKYLRDKKYRTFFFTDTITLPSYRRVQHICFEQRPCASSIFHFYAPFSLYLKTNFPAGFPLHFRVDGAL